MVLCSLSNGQIKLIFHLLNRTVFLHIIFSKLCSRLVYAILFIFNHKCYMKQLCFLCNIFIKKFLKYLLNTLIEIQFNQIFCIRTQFLINTFRRVVVDFTYKEYLLLATRRMCTRILCLCNFYLCETI